MFWGAETWSLKVGVLREGGFPELVSPGKWWMGPGMEAHLGRSACAGFPAGLRAALAGAAGTQSSARCWVLAGESLRDYGAEISHSWVLRCTGKAITMAASTGRLGKAFRGANVF